MSGARARFPARYVYASLFDWPDNTLPAKTLGTPPGQPDGLGVSVAERAVLEMLYDAGTRQSLEEARNLFDGLRSPRKELLGGAPAHNHILDRYHPSRPDRLL